MHLTKWLLRGVYVKNTNDFRTNDMQLWYIYYIFYVLELLRQIKYYLFNFRPKNFVFV